MQKIEIKKYNRLLLLTIIILQNMSHIDNKFDKNENEHKHEHNHVYMHESMNDIIKMFSISFIQLSSIKYRHVMTNI